MKKEINSKTKRKWIMGGLAAFASIAMLTTGFAVWVVGVQQKERDNDISVKVDTAKNSSLYFDMKLAEGGNTIVLAEEQEVSGKFVNAEKNTGADGVQVASNPLRITFSDIEIKIGKEYSNKPTKIHFTIDDTTAPVKVTNSLITKRTGEGPWTYIKAPADITLPTASDTEKYQVDSASGNITITLGSMSCDFTWGTFFGNDKAEDNKSPCTYYNDLYANAADQTFEAATNIERELTAMHDAFKAASNKINLKATLVA